MTTVEGAPARTWDVDEVVNWCQKQLGERTADILRKNEVDGEALFSLRYEDFYHMHVPAGPRRRLVNLIAELNGRPMPPASTATLFRPFTVLKNLITEEDAVTIRDFFSRCPLDAIATGSGYSSLVLNQRFYLPSLEEKLAKLFPDMMVFATNFFGGDTPNGVYSGWHTGVNLSKLFVGNPNTFTLWIPLQTLTAETGGRLWFYNGDSLDSVIDILKVTDKKTMIFQYMMLALMEKELEAHKVTEDCHFGDGFLFWEMNPHCVDKSCSVKREALSVRLISRTAVVDTDFLQEVGEFPEDCTINCVEGKEMMTALHASLSKTKKTYDESLELLSQNTK